MQEVEHIRTIRETADCLKSEAEVELIIDQVANSLRHQYENKNPLFLCIMRGGMIFLSKLLERLQFPLEVDYIHVTRYQDGTSGTDHIEWKARPTTAVAGRSIIVVDDILDEGATLKAVLQDPMWEAADEVKTAVLIDKQHDRKVDPSFKADFTGMTIEDRYLFCYGMDYKGYLRNAPGIFAVKGL